MGLKENNGRAARRKLNRQLLIVFTFCVTLVVVLTFLGGLGGSSGSNKLRRASADFVDKVQDRFPNGHGGRRRRPHPMNGLGSDGTDDGGSYQDDKAEILEKILSAQYNLVDLHVVEDEVLRSPTNSYAGVYGSFCELDFSQHKEDPSSVPMFRDLVGRSPDCQRQQHRFNLQKVVQLARKRDEQVMNDPSKQVPKVLNLTGVVFHESRCGSTLVANTLIGMDPIHHRAYSESTPPAVAIKGVCGETYSLCTVDQAAKVLHDVMYMMSRSNDPREERVFFKFQSVTTRNLPVFTKAWPQVPWIFVYRDPVQVMMSHVRDGVDHANCARQRYHPPSSVKQIVNKYGSSHTPRLEASSMPAEYYCAAHLASITESAVSELEDETHNNAKRGIPVVYDSLPNILYEKILPDHWGIPMTSTEIENIQRVSEKYAKGRGSRAGTFQSDSERKEHEASDAVKQAAELFLNPSFDMLSNYQY